MDSNLCTVVREQDYKDWEACGYDTPKHTRRKLKLIKRSVQNRKDIPREEYVKLLVDRKRRLERIRALRPILLSRKFLNRLGVTDDEYQECFSYLPDEKSLNELLYDSLEMIATIEELLFDKGLSRQEIRSHLNTVGMGAGKILDQSEVAFDFVIWHMEPYVELIARTMGRELDEFTIEHAQLTNEIVAAEVVELTKVGDGLWLPCWHLREPTLSQARKAFPVVSDQFRRLS
ncbi:hypothetical protein BTO32_15250 [Marinobacter lutaoensis]|uniref:Uncharacterized protein n=1 Tax=Marinobacter lutaoensis TaxID=135739 RepID=A0A1V2DPL0_9GAMM|nr:hypothetical protein [Marinobacter lutaoensis]ONF42562.1 hypothetical protein BTO32_15250 [Marinobacter lutaoensis]